MFLFQTKMELFCIYNRDKWLYYVSLCLLVILTAEGKRNVLIMYGDDVGFETQIYNNTVSKTPNLVELAKKSVLIRHAYTSVSSCSPSRSALLTGMPQHQNGMYGLHHLPNHFNSFDNIQPLPKLLAKANIKTGIIGKKHVGPDTVYKFDYEATEEEYSLMQVGRNTTFMKEKVREFLGKYGKDGGFLLYIGFNDCHRCGGGGKKKWGEFCEKFGDGVSGQGVIPDWKPVFYKPEDVIVPPYLPDTPATRAEIAAQYTGYSRMDAANVGKCWKVKEWVRNCSGTGLASFRKLEHSPFLLYIGFKDNHRCAPEYKPKYGDFCEKFGNGVGTIPDWKPITYDLESVIVPYYLPDTMATREELAKLYTIWGRLDAGIGMLMSELKSHGYLDETLIIFTSDNGIPFPVAKTNLYEPGMGEPMLVSSPLHKERWGQISEALTSTTDVVPTVLDWFNVSYPVHEVNGQEVKLTGKSMLPLLEDEPSSGWDQVFSSHDMHEVTMFYPMRVIRTKKYRLIHNLNNRAPYPLATDIYNSLTFLDTLNRTRHGVATYWKKDLKTYYYRPEWELFDVVNDPHEMTNLADNGEYSEVLANLQKTLMDWRLATHDPWKCYPHGVLLDAGGCGSLDNDIPL